MLSFFGWKSSSSAPTTQKVMDFRIVGMKYCGCTRSDFEANLTFLEEPTNQYDSNAIAIFNGLKMIGYVSKDNNQEFKRLVVPGYKIVVVNFEPDVVNCELHVPLT